MSQDFHSQVDPLVENVGKVVVAGPEVIRTAVLGLLCGDHVLLDDFPGVGKTLLSKALVSMVSENVRLSGQRKCHLYCSR